MRSAPNYARTQTVSHVAAVRILVVKMGGGYLKALLPNAETVFGADIRELIGRLKFRAPAIGVQPQNIPQILDIRW
jgi:hypothetical protein